jgi:hypothetical protein
MIHTSQLELVNSRMAGGLALSKREGKTYFGNAARSEFFERTRWLHTQRGYSNTHCADSTERLAFPDRYVSQ